MHDGAGPRVLTVQATDLAGNTQVQSLIVTSLPGGLVKLEPQGGLPLLLVQDELMEALW